MDTARLFTILIVFCLASLPAPAQEAAWSQEGVASWYGGKFQGRKTASGEIFDARLLTAAHRSLPFGAVVVVTNLENGNQVQVRVNDRGPFVPGRLIDLSQAAAEKLGMMGSGTARVRLSLPVLPPAGSEPAPGLAGSQALQPKLASIQVAAFGVEANAQGLVANLAAAGLVASVEAAGPAGPWRVVLGDVALDRVEQLRAKLADLGLNQILVRKN